MFFYYQNLESLEAYCGFCCSRNNNGSRGGRSNDEDDGDYATLRQLPLPPSSSTNTDTGDDTASEEGKVSDFTVTYVKVTACILGLRV